ncbi:MAG: MarR family winged helix-turn-helix transcriptional regulator [Enterococcus sp.]
MTLEKISQLLYLVKRTDQRITDAFEKKYGFSLTRYELLMTLKGNNRQLQSEIQNKMEIDSAAITRHLKILEEKGYVTRSRNPENNREVFVALTAKARQELAHCEEKHALSTPDHPLLTEQEVDQLTYLLGKLSAVTCSKKEDNYDN